MQTMTLNALRQTLNEVREHYLDRLQQSVREFKQQHNPAGAEVLLEIDRDAPYAFRLYRMDMAAGNAGGDPIMQECNLDSYLNFAPSSLTPFPGLTLNLAPIAWNGVDVTIEVVPPSERIEQWTLRWLDVDDRHPEDKRGFQSVIHSVTKPVSADGNTTFSVDFGSAPEAAVEDLLQMLSEVGAKEVTMNSEWML